MLSFLNRDPEPERVEESSSIYISNLAHCDQPRVSILPPRSLHTFVSERWPLLVPHTRSRPRDLHQLGAPIQSLCSSRWRIAQMANLCA